VQKTKEHIAFKMLTLMLALSLLAPSVTKFAHIFAHHKHDICKGKKSVHLHEINSDCDFYKFKLSNSYCLFFSNIELLSHTYIFKISDSLYVFLNNHRQLSFSLRGPPVLV
jgi:hypothetical protein